MRPVVSMQSGPLRLTCRRFSDSSKRLGHRTTAGPIEQLDGMHDGRRRARGELRDAADIAGRNDIRLQRFDVGELAGLEPGRGPGLRARS